LFFYQKVLKKDPLGMILEKFDVIRVKDELLHLDLNRWLGKNRSIMDTLNKVHVNHAELRETELVVIGNVNLTAIFSNFREDDDRMVDLEEEDYIDDKVTPIEQKS
jgi:hypothetical protein